MSKNFELLQQLEGERWRNESSLVSPRLVRLGSLRSAVGPRTAPQLIQLAERLFLPGQSRARVVVFAGAEAGVGCTWTAAHVAQVLSSYTTDAVGIVDAGASPGVSRYFDAASLEESGSKDDGVTRISPHPDGSLWLVSSFDEADPGVPNTRRVCECWGGRDVAPANWTLTESGIQELRKHVEYVLIDAPPVTYGSAALPLAASADGVVLVVKAGETRRNTVRFAIQQLQSAGAKLLGTVFNQQEDRIPDAIYKCL